MRPAKRPEQKVSSMVGMPPWTPVQRLTSTPRATHSRTQSQRTPARTISTLSSDSEYDLFENDTENTLEVLMEAPPSSQTSSQVSSLITQPLRKKRRISEGSTSPPHCKRSCRRRKDYDDDAYTAPTTHDSYLGPRGFAERASRLLKSKEKFPVGALGRAISRHDIGADYNTFVSNSMHDIRLDVEEPKNISRTLSHIPEPADTTRWLTVLEELTATTLGLSAVLDSCLIRLDRIEHQLNEADVSLMNKLSEDEKLPEPTTLAFENVTQQWRLPQLRVTDFADMLNACFKNADLNKCMESWIRSGRGRPNDHVVSCVDFFRKFLKTACDPPELIQRYAVRLSNTCAKSERLLDLPEQIAEPLIGICLDGMRLGAGELLRSVDALKEHPSAYWNALGKTDDERSAVLVQRKTARRRWKLLVKGALQRALGDLRKYVLDEHGRLVPPPKVKIIHAAPTRNRPRSRFLDDEDDDQIVE